MHQNGYSVVLVTIEDEAKDLDRRVNDEVEASMYFREGGGGACKAQRMWKLQNPWQSIMLEDLLIRSRPVSLICNIELSDRMMAEASIVIDKQIDNALD